MAKRSKNLGFILPTSEEDAAIAAGIAADPDTYEVPTDEIAAMRPLRGRPRLEQPKASLTMRVDADTLEALKATGPGWQNAGQRPAAQGGQERPRVAAISDHGFSLPASGRATGPG